MSSRRPDPSFIADCPGRFTIDLIGDRWTVVVIAALSKGALRHGELAEFIGGISHKVLTQTLRRLETNGFVQRRAYREVPPRVEYELTPLGCTLVDPIHTLTEWARTHGEAVLNARDGVAV